MKNQFVKGLKNLFSGSSNNLPKQSKPIKKEDQIRRVVSFGGSTAEKPKVQSKEQKNGIEQLIEEIKDNRYEGLQKFPTFKQIGLNKGEVVDGQTIVLFESKCISCKMSTGKYQQIKLIATDFKLYIVDWRFEVKSFPLAKIQKLHRYINNQNYMKINIGLKDGRKFKLKVNIEYVWKKIFDQIEKFAFVKYKQQFFAFQFFKLNKELQDKFRGWSLYSPETQFSRMGLKLQKGQNDTSAQSDFKILWNKQGQVCDTYPQILVVPSRLPLDALIRCSKFRSRNRMPALTYAYQYRPNCFSSLYRSSQSKTGVKNNRSKDDEMMLSIIGNPKVTVKQLQANPLQKVNCIIYDARGYMAALGNKISGKGYQSPEYYTNCRVQFLNIPNIHAVRQSYNKVIKAVYGEDSKFFSALSDSQWYDFVFLILNGALQIAANLKKGINILVHCSDGWDRTAQLCALAGIILDPYYRTIEGFAILIEKDWIHFGHQFSVRLGQGMNEPGSQQRSQIFLQFLDCVSQLLYQFPSQFEFNYKFLKQIGQQAYSSIFGNFLCNCEMQMKRYNIAQQTVSLWSFILSDRQQYMNPYYLSSGCFLEVSTSQKSMRFFKQLFLSNIDAFKDIYDIYSCKFTEDNLEIMYKQLKKEKELLDEKYKENEFILKELDEEISRKQSEDLEFLQDLDRDERGNIKRMKMILREKPPVVVSLRSLEVRIEQRFWIFLKRQDQNLMEQLLLYIFSIS